MGMEEEIREARLKRRGCGGCYGEERLGGRGGHWNVGVFLSYVFQDPCFPIQCHDRI